MQDPPPSDLVRLRRLDVLLVRHAESVPPGGPHEENDLPLTEDGRAAADDLADQLAGFALSAVYSSPYPRALQTVQPAAERHDLQVLVVDDLRERLLSPTPLADWRGHLEKAFANPDYAPPGGESGRSALRRVAGVLDLLRVRHPDGGRVLVGSHGNLITLMLQALEPRIDFAFWEEMPTPAVYWLEHDGERWQAMGGNGFDQLNETA
jgi:2,3-bisphosphoglycerate-dependent phosphoglycerate mutase